MNRLLLVLLLVLAPVALAPAASADGTVDARVAGLRRAPYRNPRYVRRCRSEARREAPAGVTVESREEARDRAVQLVRHHRLDTALLFARIVYGESGTPSPGVNDNEPLAILAVIDAQRGAMTRAEMMARYSPRRVFASPTDARQLWIAELQANGSKPPSWNSPANWRAYGCPRWLATLESARRVLSRHPGRVGAGPCAEVPHHWGGDMDSHRAEARGWLRVDCGVTRNTFWVVPRRRSMSTTKPRGTRRGR